MPNAFGRVVVGRRPSGSGSVAIEPSIESGAGGSMPSASQSRSRPSSASAWFDAMTSGQPPGACAAIQSIAAGSVRNPVGSAVPTQSNSWRKRVRSPSGAFAPCDTTSGWIRLAAVLADPQDRRALRPAQPLVAVAGPVRGAERVERRPAPSRARGRRRRACRCRGRSSAATISATGKMSAVGLVTWLTTTSRVRGR